MLRFFLFTLIMFPALSLSPMTGLDGGSWLSAAQAEDDDDGDDDDDDDDDDDRPTPRRAAAPAPLPLYAPNEIITRDLQNIDLGAIQAQGFTLLESALLEDGSILRRFRKPAALTMIAAREALRGLGPEGVDFNHYYRTSQSADCEGESCLAREMIDWPRATDLCGTPPKIGMIDTGLNPDHAVFAGHAIELHQIESSGPNSGKQHGTAVASLLVGDPDSRSPALIPGAELIAVDAFHKVRSDERMDAFSLISALDLLAERQVRVINLSFAGPANDALADHIAEFDAKGIVLVAAAGNFGPAAKPAYPAAYEQVLAVTAVDRRGLIYRRANRGDHIDLAAPGVGVWTATSVSGARTQTGTSYAAPFVTAAAALLLQSNPAMTPPEIRAALIGAAKDLGESGRDAIYGHGLLAPQSPCP